MQALEFFDQLKTILQDSVKIQLIISESLYVTFEKLILERLNDNHCLSESSIQPNSNLIPRKEAMKMWNLSSTFIYNKMRTGELPFLRIGRKIFFKQIDIENTANNKPESKLWKKHLKNI